MKMLYFILIYLPDLSRQYASSSMTYMEINININRIYFNVLHILTTGGLRVLFKIVNRCTCIEL